MLLAHLVSGLRSDRAQFLKLRPNIQGIYLPFIFLFAATLLRLSLELRPSRANCRNQPRYSEASSAPVSIARDVDLLTLGPLAGDVARGTAAALLLLW